MKYYLSVVSIFKNESDIMKEWIEHYLMEGVDHFYLIDNGSTDNYQEILEPYIKEQLVDLNIDNRPHLQEKHYNSYYLDKVKKESEWVIIVDFDELIYSRKQFKTISDYLKSLLQNVAQVYVTWKLFGSNGLIQQPNSCIHDFTMRTKYDHVKTNGMIDTERILTKTIVKTKYLIKMSIHFSVVDPTNTREITSDNQDIPPVQSDTFKKISEEILQKSFLHCNHYPIQSYEWFKKIKMSRGSASSEKNDKIRTIEYYNSFDSHSNQVSDKELSMKRDFFKAYYGNVVYFDVTRQLYKKFMNQSKIIIEDNEVFNNNFGDPSPHVQKYLIIRQGCQLKIYPEEKHGKIIINLK